MTKLFRTFLAIKPSSYITKLLNKTIEELKKQNLENTKWVSLKNLHLTLVFLGLISNDLSIKYLQKLRQQFENFAPFELKLSKIGFFGNCQNPKIIWVGVEHNTILNDIVKQAREIASDMNIAIDNKRFKAHLTLGHNKNTSIKTISNIQMPKLITSKRTWEISKIDLIKSEIRSPIIKYKTIDQILLTSNTMRSI